VARRPAAEPLRAPADAAARLGDAAHAEQLPQPATDRRVAAPPAARRPRHRGASPIAADEIEILDYADTQGLFARVKEAIRLCYSAGFKKHDLAIISYHGRAQSQLLALDALGQTSLRHFTGAYDLFGQPVYSQGDVLVESVYRFKGQAAPAVIFTEIDFAVLDDRRCASSSSAPRAVR
jgi:hypothetical protein